MLLLAAVVAGVPAAAAANQESQPSSPAARQITAGQHDSCADLGGVVHCWGFAGDRRLGYGTSDDVGDDETPGAAGPIDFGAGRTATAISAGSGHTCALLDDKTVRCWGFGGDGRLGYVTLDSSAAGQTPGAAPPVDLGSGHTATAITAGDAHTCAILDDASIRCWGFGTDGRLGYGNAQSIGDNETPGSARPVDLGAGHGALAISAGRNHTCALLDDQSVRCWGFNGFGQLGYGHTTTIGDSETPASVRPVNLGAGHTARAISAGKDHTCALRDDGAVLCWGAGGSGQLGYANTDNVGATQTPGTVGPVNLGGHAAAAISAGGDHSCAILDDATVRCWGAGGFGQLGYGNSDSIGDDENPGSAGPVNLGAGRTAVAIAAGGFHTCAVLDDATVRCWGYGASGRLGYCSERSVGDDEQPGTAGPVDLALGGAGCATSSVPPPGPAAPSPSAGSPQLPPNAGGLDARSVEVARARRMSRCLRAAARRAAGARKLARKSCFVLHGRTPGRVTSLHARAVSATKLVLTFTAPGSDGRKAPAARAYLVKQSPAPIRRSADFNRSQALCGGSCRFKQTTVGAVLTLTVTHLRPRTAYYFAVAARDNVSHLAGPRSKAVVARTS